MTGRPGRRANFQRAQLSRHGVSPTLPMRARTINPARVQRLFPLAADMQLFNEYDAASRVGRQTDAERSCLSLEDSEAFRCAQQSGG
jgi:hypothetical protein